MNALIMKLRRHFLDGLSFDDDISLEDKSRLMKGRAPNPLVKLTWIYNSELFGLDVNLTTSISKLPDSSGFIAFEDDWMLDNCLLLDAYGKERMRLMVPWELTELDIPKDAVMSFKNISDPYKNPKDGKLGQFGVSAWIEGSGSGGYAEGDWYFELDYHTGKFLWGREIRS